MDGFIPMATLWSTDAVGCCTKLDCDDGVDFVDMAAVSRCAPDGAEVFNWPQQARVDTISNFKVLSVVSEAAFKLHPASLFIGSEDHAFSLRLIAASLWTILIWIVPALALSDRALCSLWAELGILSVDSLDCQEWLLRAGSVMGAVLLGPLLMAFGIWLVSWFHRPLQA